MKKLKLQLTEILSATISSLSYPTKLFSLTPPKNPHFGDLSSNLALLLAKDLKKNPMEIGKTIINELNQNLPIFISDISLTEPGFINFKLKNSFYQSRIKDILNDGSSYGKGDIGKGKTANVEFVSANPTGPLTVGHGRNAVLGDTVSNILEWQNYDVTREYYFNDAGRQMRILGESVEASYMALVGKDINYPENGYQGEYIKDIAKIIINEKGENINSGDQNFKNYAEKFIFNEIKNSLKNLRVNFDSFINEKQFYENGSIENLIEELRDKDLIYEKDGATWFRATALGKKQDRVYIKNTGEPTYRVPDTVYHRDKISRKYDMIIDIFGSDHADTYPDVLLALEAIGLNTDHIKVLIYQFVTLLRGGKKVKMSTRKANFVTLDQLIDEVGSDVVRYFFIMRSMNTHLDFDLDLAKDHSDKNPVFYLQYAYARICNIIKHGEQSGYKLDLNFDPSLLSHKDEIKLIHHMIRFPENMDFAYENLEPQIIANYLQDLASHFHKFYSKCRVITDNAELTNSRLALIATIKIILKNGLNVLGISAPERM